MLLRRFLIFDTQTAIPVGTLAAVIVSGITYVMMVWSLASICEREGGRGGLFKDFAIMMPASADWIEESAVAPLIIAGMFKIKKCRSQCFDTTFTILVVIIVIIVLYSSFSL